MSEPTAVKRTRHFTPAVFWPSVALILVFVLLAAAKPEGTNSVIANISSVVVKNAGWCYILAVAGFVVFALVAYRRYNATIVGAAGAVSFAFEWVLELFLSGHLAKGVLYNVIYLVCGMASGIVLAGLLAWALTNALGSRHSSLARKSSTGFPRLRRPLRSLVATVKANSRL